MVDDNSINQEINKASFLLSTGSQLISKQINFIFPYSDAYFKLLKICIYYIEPNVT